MKLTENFTLDEFLRTDQGHYIQDVKELGKHPAIVRNLKNLCEEILQPIRCTFNKPVKIKRISNNRTKQRNKRIEKFATSIR